MKKEEKRIWSDQDIEEYLAVLIGDDPQTTGIYLAGIKRAPTKDDRIVKILTQLLQSHGFYRMKVHGLFWPLRLAAGAAHAAERFMLSNPEPVIVYGSPRPIHSSPNDREIWDMVNELNIPPAGDPYQDFIKGALGGLEILFRQGKLD